MFAVPTLDGALETTLRLVFGDPDSSVQDVEARALRLLRGLTPIVWERDPATFQFLHVSRTAETVVGYPAARWTTDFWPHFLIHPDDRLNAISAYALSVGRVQDYDFTYRAIRADRAVIVLRDMVKVLKGTHDIARTLLGLTVQIAGPALDGNGRDSSSCEPSAISRQPDADS